MYEGTSRRTEDWAVNSSESNILYEYYAIHSNHYVVVCAAGRAVGLARQNWAATMKRIDSRDRRLEGAR